MVGICDSRFLHESSIVSDILRSVALTSITQRWYKALLHTNAQRIHRV